MEERMEEPIKLLIVDDQTLYREGLRELVSHWPEFKVIGDVPNGRVAVEFVRNVVPDLILMDVQMPVMDGIEAAGIISAKRPEIKIIMLTVSAEDEHLFSAIRNGAQGYILKDMPARQLRDRLRGVMAGEGVLSGVVAEKVIRKLGALSEPSDSAESPMVPTYRFTERERQILKLVAQGKSNEEIGAELYISAATVKKQLSALMQNLYAENRVQLAVFAVRAGLLD